MIDEIRKSFRATHLPVLGEGENRPPDRRTRRVYDPSEEEPLDVERELRIRAHRERVEREMRELGIFIPHIGALKSCNIEGCLYETTNNEKYIIRQGWHKDRDKWYCPYHSRLINISSKIKSSRNVG